VANAAARPGQQKNALSLSHMGPLAPVRPLRQPS
jgi:hypothetical protein